MSVSRDQVKILDLMRDLRLMGDKTCYEAHQLVAEIFIRAAICKTPPLFDGNVHLRRDTPPHPKHPASVRARPSENELGWFGLRVVDERSATRFDDRTGEYFIEIV